MQRNIADRRRKLPPPLLQQQQLLLQHYHKTHPQPAQKKPLAIAENTDRR
jgi:hypothetical protein